MGRELLIPADCNECRQWRSRSHSGFPCRETWRKYSDYTLSSSCQLEHDERGSLLVLPEIQTKISSVVNETTQVFGYLWNIIPTSLFQWKWMGMLPWQCTDIVQSCEILNWPSEEDSENSKNSVYFISLLDGETFKDNMYIVQPEGVWYAVHVYYTFYLNT